MRKYCTSGFWPYLLLCTTTLYSINITNNSSNIGISANLPTDKNFLKNHKDRIFLRQYQALTINVQATGKYNGDPNTLYGILLSASNSDVITYNGYKTLNFRIDSTGMTGNNGSIFFSSKGTS